MLPFARSILLKHLVLAAALALCACAATPPENPKPAEPAKPVRGEAATKPHPNDIRRVAVFTSYLVGTYESIAQDKGPGVGTRMHFAPFWTELGAKGDFWFYVEIAKVGDDAKPFHQRIYRFTAATHRLRAEVFELPGPPREFVNEWRKPQPFERFRPDQLRIYEDCAMPIGAMESMFWAHTAGTKCRTDNPTVAYERTDLFASSAGMKIGTFGYDPAGRQVAGEAGVWDFRRITAELR